MSVVVVVPTYNEKDNLPELAEKIFALKIPNLGMVVVDDNSPDGTGKIAEALSKKYLLAAIHRPKKGGIGTAYVRAFKTILPQRPHYIIQMDADLSHDPAVIPDLLRSAKTYDVVLGSRYVSGGAIINWDPLRKWVSRIGNAYARAILGVPYRDLTGGYKCFRREVLEAIDLDSLSSVGYNFQIETTYKAHKKGFRIAEVPILFTERKVGTSKFNLGIILESFWKVLLLRFHA